MATSFIVITSQDFTEKVLNAPKLVIVDFSVEQSTACKIQDAEFEAVSAMYPHNVADEEKVIFAKLPLSGKSDLTTQWNVNDIPTLIFFKDGQEIHRIIGIVMRDRLRRHIEGVLVGLEPPEPRKEEKEEEEEEEEEEQKNVDLSPDRPDRPNIRKRGELF